MNQNQLPANLVILWFMVAILCGLAFIAGQQIANLDNASFAPIQKVINQIAKN